MPGDQLARIRALGALDTFDLVIVAGIGLVGAHVVQSIAPCMATDSD